jgi:uncharacterized membrane protein YkoI
MSMKQGKGSLVVMMLASILLAGFGYSQFGTVSLAMQEGGEHEHHEEHAEYQTMRSVESTTMLAGLIARYGGHVTKVEREYGNGRMVYEVKLLDAEGKRRELLVDPDTGAVLREGD